MVFSEGDASPLQNTWFRHPQRPTQGQECTEYSLWGQWLIKERWAEFVPAR